MALPSGIQTAVITFSPASEIDGGAVTANLRVTPSHALTWAATGHVITNTTAALAASGTTTFLLPTDQDGFVDTDGNAIRGWWYTVKITLVDDGKAITHYKRFTIPEGTTNLSLDTVADVAQPSPATVTVTTPSGPTGPVVSTVNGESGDVTISAATLGAVTINELALATADLQEDIATNTTSIADLANTVANLPEPETPTPATATVHVGTGTEARPTATSVFWIGGASQPTNMLEGDLWFAAAPVAPLITTTSLNGMVANTVFTQSLAATGSSPTTFAVTSGSLPAGLALSSAGVLSGTPTAAAAYSFTVTATNSAGSDIQAYSGTVESAPTAPTITTTSLTALTVNTAFAQTLAATGTAPITFTVTTGSLPDGLGLTTSGSLTGTPTTEGAYSFTVTATNTAGSDTQDFSGTVLAESSVVTLTKTVYADAVPSYTYTTHDDGALGDWMSNQFYATAGSQPLDDWTIDAGRVYIPAGSAAIGQSCAMALITRTSGGFTGSDLPNDALFDSNGTKSATITLVQGWNTLPFATPQPLLPGVGFLVGYQIAGGTLYIYNNENGDDGVQALALPHEQASDGFALYLSENDTGATGYRRSFYNSGTSLADSYAIDVVVSGPEAAYDSDADNSIYGATPHETLLTGDDGGGGLKLATAFYTTDAAGMTVAGGRVFIPAIPAGAGDLTIFGAVGFTMGGERSVPFWSAVPDSIPGQYVTIPYAELTTGWNTVTFPTAFQISQVQATPTDGTWAWIGYYFGNGDHYFYTGSGSTDSTASPVVSGLYRAERLFPGAANSIIGTIYNNLYGIDVVVA